MNVELKSMMYDRYNPERVFLAGSVIKVNDEARASGLLKNGVGIKTIKEANEELDPVDGGKKVAKKTTRKNKR